jgi:hypothetical protein
MNFFSWFRRRPPATPRDVPVPESTAVDLKLERQLHYLPVSAASPCPRCRTPLLQQTAVYVVRTRHERQPADNFVIGGDFGYYCPHCPTVVVNPEDLTPYLDAGAGKFDPGPLVAILGLLDPDGFTEEEKSRPLDELEEIPLVPFHSGRTAASKRRPGKSKKGKRR